MNIRFSERFGYKEKREFLQLESIDLPLRTNLWNVFYTTIWERLPTESNFMTGTPYIDFWGQNFLIDLQTNFFSQPVDEIDYEKQPNTRKFKDFFFDNKWYEIFDLIEFVSNSTYIYECPDYYQDFTQQVNEALERHVSAYRFINNHFAPITDKTQIETIEEALSTSSEHVAKHLDAALHKFSNREHPDYRNSIKEAISAVESVCRELTGASTLDRALKKIQTKIYINEQFKQGLEKFSHYVNDEDGIRHANMKKPKPVFDEAKFMLVFCSACVNYLTAKSVKFEE